MEGCPGHPHILLIFDMDMEICGQPGYVRQSESPVRWLFFSLLSGHGLSDATFEESRCRTYFIAGCLTLLFMPLFTKVGHSGFSLKKRLSIFQIEEEKY